MLKRLISVLRERAREKRRAVFLKYFNISTNTKILDLGANDGEHIASILRYLHITPENVHIADINEEAILKGHKKFGFSPILLDEYGRLPCKDKFYDVVFCSSVIEHVTIPKEQRWKLWSGKEFNNRASIQQERFAKEIKRVGKGYFVQTPNKWFVIESHTWLPFMGYLPRRLLIPILHLSNRLWIKGSSPDWKLLTKKDMLKLFPEGKCIEEKWLGVTKSFMAIKV